MKKTKVRRGLVVLILISICILGFNFSHKSYSSKSGRTHLVSPGDLQPGRHYLFWDHGAGVSIVQFSRREGDNLYTNFAINPSQASFSQGVPFTTYDAGDIQRANGQEIAQLHRSINAGRYVP
jgi:hypothetical protein